MAERNFVHRFPRHQIAAQQTGNSFSVFFGDGRVKAQSVLSSGIPLPPKAHNDVAVAQQPCVSRIVGEVPSPAVDDADNARTPTVRNLQQQGAVAFARVLRADRNEIRRKFHLAVFQIYSLVEVDDAPVVSVGDGNGGIDASDDPFIRSGTAERLAIEYVGARGDLDADDLGA